MTVRTMHRFLFVFVFFTQLTGTLHAQIPAHWYLNKESGLPTNTVYRILQDKDDLIWIATSSGLVRYNSLEFTNYTTSGLQDEEFIELNLDSLNRVWVTNISNQIAYVENGKLNVVELTNPPNGKIEYLTIAFHRNFLLLGIIPKNPTPSEVTFFYKVPMHEISSKIDLNQYLFYTHETYIREIIKIDDILLVPGKAAFLESFFLKDTIRHQIPKVITKDFSSWPKSRRKYHLLEKGLHAYSGDKRFAIWGDKGNIIYANLENIIHSIKKVNDDIWFLTTKGIQFFNLKTKSFTQQTIFKDHVFSRYFKDKEGNIWLATLNKGILIIPSVEFQYPSHDKFPFFSLSPYQNGSNFLAGARDRLVLFNEAKIPVDLSIQAGIERVLSIEHNKGIIIYAADRGAFWMNNLNTQAFHFPLSNASKAILLDKKGKIWLGTYDALKNFNTKEHWKEEGKIIIKEKTLAIEEDAEGNIWAGTISGLYKVKNGKQISKVGKDSTSFFVKDLKMGWDSVLYVATSNNGVLQVNTYNSKIEHLKLPYVDCFNTLIYDEQSLWLGGNKGILHYDLRDNTVHHISRYDGLPSNEVSALLRRGKFIWAATSKGLVKFPRNVVNNPRPPTNVTIKKIYANDIEIPLKDSLVRLKHNQNSLRIEFKAINYYLRGTTEFKYRLLPSGEWLNTKQSFAQFSNLSPGKYSFELSLTNNVAIANIPKIYFEIDRAWWQELWVQLLFTLFVVITTVWISFMRQKKTLAKEKEDKNIQKKIAELKITALQAQMNPHFIFNCLNNIQYFILNKKDDLAMKTLGMFSKLIRDVFDFSAKKIIYLEEELAFLNLYIDLEKLRFDDSLTVNISISDYIKDNLFALKAPPLLIQPIIENAFEHGLLHKIGDKVLDIYFEMEGKYLKCIVQDNGVGRNFSSTSNQWEIKQDRLSGLKLTQERLLMLDDSSKQINNIPLFLITDLKNVSDKRPIGTRVEMRIKILNR